MSLAKVSGAGQKGAEGLAWPHQLSAGETLEGWVGRHLSKELPLPRSRLGVRSSGRNDWARLKGLGPTG